MSRAATPVEDAWGRYRQNVLADNAPRIQVDETRKAFRAGAYAVWAMMMQAARGGEAEAVALYARLGEEFDAFRAEVAAEAAIETASRGEGR